jgi:hypothetical protein
MDWFGVFALAWPMFAFGSAALIAVLASRYFDRRERRRHPAE